VGAGSGLLDPSAQARRSMGGGLRGAGPRPGSFTTIAWRVFHIASCKVMYHEYAFGPGELTWEVGSLKRPSTLEGMLSMLERGHALLVDDLGSLTSDDELAVPRLTNWGEKWPTWRIFWTMILHDAHHGAEIGSLRDLHRYR
jgi:DinB superfamily